MLKEFMNDRVTLVKKTGQRIEDLLASVQSKLILTDNVKVPVEDGDTFERTLPSGVTESYEVLDAGFQQAFHGIPAHYQSKVQKRTAKVRGSSTQHTVYNLIGPNARVNIQSTDSSTNVVNVESTVLFDNLRGAIRTSISDSELRKALMVCVEAMEAAVGTRTFADPYKNFIALAADHISVFGPFLPALTQFLV